MKAAKFAADLRAVGFSARELRDARFRAADLKNAGFRVNELKDVDFTATEMKAAGYSAAELRSARYTAFDLKKAGYSMLQLKQGRFKASELRETRCPAKDLIAVDTLFRSSRRAGFAVELYGPPPLPSSWHKGTVSRSCVRRIHVQANEGPEPLGSDQAGFKPTADDISHAKAGESGLDL